MCGVALQPLVLGKDMGGHSSKLRAVCVSHLDWRHSGIGKAVTVVPMDGHFW